jgi:hypothetical protein
LTFAKAIKLYTHRCFQRYPHFQLDDLDTPANTKPVSNNSTSVRNNKGKGQDKGRGKPSPNNNHNRGRDRTQRSRTNSSSRFRPSQSRDKGRGPKAKGTGKSQTHTSGNRKPFIHYLCVNMDNEESPNKRKMKTITIPKRL